MYAFDRKQEALILNTAQLQDAVAYLLQRTYGITVHIAKGKCLKLSADESV